MNIKKICLFILISFGISWGSYIAKTLAHIVPGSVVSIIFGAIYASGPVIGAIVTQKIIYKEGMRQIGWSFDRRNYKWFLYTPLLFIALILAIFAIIGIFGNTHFISQFGQLDFSPRPFHYRLTPGADIHLSVFNLPALPPLLSFIFALGIVVIMGVTVYIPGVFCEELGWRGLMLRETQSLGFFASNFFIGITWGLWHLPLIVHGTNYPHHPYLGILMMCIMTTTLSPIMAYVRLKTKSILGACMLHGMIDASRPLFIFYVVNADEFYSSPVGWAGMIAFILMTLFIYVSDRKFVADYANI